MTVHAGAYGPEPFIDKAGNAVPSALVSVFDPDGVTLAGLYVDRDRSVALSNPLPNGVAPGVAGLDERGNGVFYAEPGSYRMVVAVGGVTVYDGPVRVEVDEEDVVSAVGSTVTLPIGQADVTGLPAVLTGLAAVDTTEAAARQAHEADTTNVHGIVDTAALVETSDVRLSDARIPTAHAASHQNGGTDEVSVDGSQITSGTVDDARLPSTIARDTDVAAAVASKETPAGAQAKADAAQAFAVQRANHTGAQAESTVTGLVDDLAAKAPLVSPALSGTPTAPTATQGTNTTQVASTEFVRTEVGLLVPKSVLTNDGDLLTRTGGVPARITRAGLAADAAFTAAFASLAGNTFTAEQVAPDVKATGKTGLTAQPLILAGGTASGAPTTGTHTAGELEVDALGFPWYCTVGGTPGTWICIASGREIFSVENTGAGGSDTTTSLSVGDLPNNPMSGAVPVLPVPCWLHFYAPAANSGVNASPANNTAGDGIIVIVSDGTNLFGGDRWVSPTANANKSLEMWYRIPAGTAAATYKIQFAAVTGGTARLVGNTAQRIIFRCVTA